MISWIQRYFQKHFRLVFGIVLVAIAVPLVAIYSQSSSMSGGGGRGHERLFFGYNISNEEFMAKRMSDAQLSLELRGLYRGNGGQVQQEAMTRLAGLALADRLHLPEPTEKEVSAYVATLRIFRDEQGNFDQKRYSDFAASLANNKQFSIADANRLFREDARLAALGSLLGGPGYVLPADVKDILKHADSKWTINVATLDYASFDAGANPTEEALKKYYAENADRYEIGARIKASEVVFNATDYLPTVPPTEEQVRRYYDSNPSRFPVPPEKDEKTGAPKIEAKPASAEANFAKVRPQVEVAMRLEAGRQQALKAASDFTVKLYQEKPPANSPALATFLAEQKRTATPLPPFVPDSPPPELSWIAYQAEAVSRLNESRYFSDPLNTPAGAVVLLWNASLPPYKPLLAEVHDKVAADYKEAEKRKKFIAQGQAIHARLEAALKGGTAFDKAAAADKLDVKSYANFTEAEPPKDAPQAALQALGSLNAGQVSDMISSGDKGYFVFVAQKQLPDLTPANPRYAETAGNIARYLSQSADQQILASLADAEWERTAPEPAK